MSEGHIYLLGTAEPLAVKIGFTKQDPRVRLKQLQTGNPMKLKLLGWFPGTQREERGLHESLAAYRIGGEWFRLDDSASGLWKPIVTLIQINNALSGYTPEAAHP
ncbi:GIY-YIG nuclease family protein [Novosphingobium sp. RL4]|uniref:GIY-YIG nuclease family protein n=1 Tax=Novosphingobium sp. RL4 TaxID=3109595 RepID=UPI002D793BD3|nr:GIY-YIG nuclease family protein [Novosphingobium sp. RL4]WRT91897.1 GIY-YIG nuclease family protein [Novosphingobium sp. RL4]